MKLTTSASKLNTSVLVLNRFYLAVHVVPARRAFILLYRDLAEVVHVEEGQYANYDFGAWCEMSEFLAIERRQHTIHCSAGRQTLVRENGRQNHSVGKNATNEAAFDDDEEDWIRAVNFELRIPRVIRLLRYDRAPRHTLRFNRRNLFARDGHCCQYCGKRLQLHQLSLDHVIPRSRGGETSWENVVSACVDCNTRKGSRTPREARMQLIREPVKPKYNPLMALKLNNPKYEIWKAFMPAGQISVQF